MSLLAERETPGHLSEAVIHFNQALDESTSGASKVEVARSLFDGLNKIQTEWLVTQPDQQKIGEVKGFQLISPAYWSLLFALTHSRSLAMNSSCSF